MATREICKCCGRINPLGFHVTNHIWRESVPSYYEDDILCIICFAQFADENGIEWDVDVDFYPVSLITHNRSIH